MSQLPPDTLLGDIDALFCAVTARLRDIADRSGESIAAPAAAPATGANDRIRASVLECVTELEQLHSMLAHEVARRLRLEKIVNDAQAALERAPPEIVAVLGLTLRMPPVERLPTRVPEPARAA